MKITAGRTIFRFVGINFHFRASICSFWLKICKFVEILMKKKKKPECKSRVTQAFCARRPFTIWSSAAALGYARFLRAWIRSPHPPPHAPYHHNQMKCIHNIYRQIKCLFFLRFAVVGYCEIECVYFTWTFDFFCSEQQSRIVKLAPKFFNYVLNHFNYFLNYFTNFS